MSEDIRKAASLIAVRDGDDGPEVLVLERTDTSRFLPGYVVFPGGAVDPEDHARAMAWFGEEGQAARAAAVRELAEEVGLIVTSDGVQRADAHRDPLAVVRDAPPEVGGLPEVAHWVAPASVRVRFDATYFAVATGPGVEPEVDGTEAARAWWTSPRALMDEWGSGERKLYWPTYFTMSELTACGSSAALMALRLRTREPDDDELDRLPRSVFWED